MTVCVGCGLTSESGIVEVKPRPNGGVHCDEDGVYVSLGEAAVSSFVGTSQQTTSATYTDLATIGPQVTVITGTQALVMWDTEYFGVVTGIHLNGTTYLAIQGERADGANVGHIITVSTIYKFAVADFVQSIVFHDNAANAARNILATPNTSPEFSAVWVGVG